MQELSTKIGYQQVELAGAVRLLSVCEISRVSELSQIFSERIEARVFPRRWQMGKRPSESDIAYALSSADEAEESLKIRSTVDDGSYAFKVLCGAMNDKCLGDVDAAAVGYGYGLVDLSTTCLHKAIHDLLRGNVNKDYFPSDTFVPSGPQLSRYCQDLEKDVLKDVKRVRSFCAITRETEPEKPVKQITAERMKELTDQFRQSEELSEEETEAIKELTKRIFKNGVSDHN